MQKEELLEKKISNNISIANKKLRVLRNEYVEICKILHIYEYVTGTMEQLNPEDCFLFTHKRKYLTTGKLFHYYRYPYSADKLYLYIECLFKGWTEKRKIDKHIVEKTIDNILTILKKESKQHENRIMQMEKIKKDKAQFEKIEKILTKP